MLSHLSRLCFFNWQDKSRMILITNDYLCVALAFKFIVEQNIPSLCNKLTAEHLEVWKFVSKYKYCTVNLDIIWNADSIYYLHFLY